LTRQATPTRPACLLNWTIGGDPIAMTENTADGIITYEATVTYASGVELTAVSSEGYAFRRWGGDTFGDSETAAIDNIMLDMAIFAYFSEDGAEYHVDPSDLNASDDLSSGSTQAPFASLGYALNFLMPGNTLKLHQGTYGSIVIDSTVSGAEGSLISFIGDGEVVIDGTGQDEAMVVEGDYILIRNFKLKKGGSYGLRITGDSATVERCDIYDNGLHGLYAQDVSNVAIDNCVMRDNVSSGISLNGGTKHLIQNCVFSSNGADGMAIFGADDVIARYNIALKNTGAGFSIGDAACYDATLYNNIAYDNTGHGFDVAVTDAILINNIAHENGGDAVAGLPLLVDYNYWGDGAFVTDHDLHSISDTHDADGNPRPADDQAPGFVNIEDLDVVTDLNLPNFGRCYGLRLKQSSICLDSGTALGVGANSDPAAFTADMTSATRYFRIGDGIRIGNIGTAVIEGILGDTLTLDKGLEADGLDINPARVYGIPDRGAYERSTHPWVFDEGLYDNNPYYYPIRGTAMIEDARLQAGDWIGVFDADDNCYGVAQYRYDDINDRYYYTLSVHGDEGGLDGFSAAEKLNFKFYIAGTGDIIAAVSNPIARYEYPAEGGIPTGEPTQINLVNADVLKITLGEGWNFISFNVEPESTKVDETFISVFDQLEYVADYKGDYRYYDRTTNPPSVIIEGDLDKVDSYNSYYVKVSDNCDLFITGLKVLRQAPSHTYEFQEGAGWYSLSYLYESWTDAMGLGLSGYTGVFKEIISDVVWVKGAAELNGAWCTPEYGDLRLGPGSGIFIKLSDSCDLTFSPQE